MNLDSLYLYLIYPLEVLMRWCLETAYFSTHSYGLAIIELAVIVSLSALPLHAMARGWQAEDRRLKSALSPGLRHIKQAFSGQERFFMVQTLYRQHNYHPILGLRSSAGLLIQIPLFFAAYHFLSNYQPLDGVSFLWFENLAAPDRVINVGHASFNVMPLVMTSINLCSARASGQDLDRRERGQLYLLAAIFLILLYDSPVALVLYWTINNLFSWCRILVGRRAESVRTLHRLAGAISTTTLPPLGLAAVVVALATSIALVKTDALPIALGPAAAFATFGLLFYLSVVAVGSLMRSFSPTPFRQISAFLIVILYASTLISLFNVLSSSQVHYALDQTRNRIWIGLALVVVLASMARFSISPGTPLLDVDRSFRLFFLSGLLIVAVVCVFSPLSLFASEPTEFSISIISATSGTIQIGLITLAVLSASYFMMAPRLRGCYAFLLTCTATLVGLYTFALVGEYGSIDFFNLEEQSFMTPGRLVADILVIAIVGTVTLYAFKKNHWRPVTQLLTIALVSTLVLSAHQLYSFEIPFGEDRAVTRGDGYGLAPLPDYNEDLLNFSKHEKNVVVIMLDGFNAYTLPVSLEREPTLRDGLDGFTWFRNTLAAGYVTALGEPGIHGGHDYTPLAIRKREYDDLRKEFAKGYRVFTDAIGEKGFDVSLAGVQNARCDEIVKVSRLPPVVCVDSSYGHDYASSVPWPNRDDTSMLDGTAVDIERVDQRRVLAAISAFRAAPFSLKEVIYGGGGWLNTYPLAQKNIDGSKNAARDLSGLYALSQVSSSTSVRGTFKYIQNNTTHRPFYIDPETCLPSLEESNDEVARDCALRSIIQWLNWLKKEGIYDNTMIVLVSDHGSRRHGSAVGVPLTRTNALLMVKDFGERGGLEQASTFMSNADVPAIVCAAIGRCPEIEADPRQDTRSRTLYFVKGTNGKNYRRFSNENVVYQVKGNIFDTDNWRILK